MLDLQIYRKYKQFVSKFKIYKASAGSGKTRSLVLEYLQIVISNPNEYKSTLAVTFTNNATNEMKERILKELYILSNDTSNSNYIDDLKRNLKSTSNIKFDIFHIQKRAAEALRNILHDFSRFNILTIDSFFQKIIRSFAKDIGLNAGYGLELDSERTLQLIIHQVIDKLEKNSDETSWMVKAAITKLNSGGNLKIRNELETIAKEVFKEKFQEKQLLIQSLLENKKTLNEEYNKVEAFISEFEKTCFDLIDSFFIELENFELDPVDFKYKKKSFVSKLLLLKNNLTEGISSSILNALNNEQNWYTKSSFHKVKIESFYSRGNYLLQKIVSYYQNNQTQYITCILLKKHYPFYFLFNKIIEELVIFKDENNIMFLSDANVFINEIIGNNDESFVFEKIGNYYLNFLIDEFQDTSKLQWKNFRPLISNSISQGKTSLVVGDVKQAIYRFRNGDYQLLLNQAAKELPYNEIITLDTNYRSAKNIVKFNNTIYKVLPRIFQNIYIDKSQNDSFSEDFLNCYKNQEQKVKSNKEGYVKLKFINEDNTKQNGLNELTNDLLIAFDRGYRPNDMVILVEKSDTAKIISNHLFHVFEILQMNDEIDIITEKTLNVMNSKSVRIIINALFYLSDFKNEVNLCSLKNEVNDKSKVETLIENRKIYKSETLIFLVDKLIRLFELSDFKAEYIYIQRLRDVLIDYTRSNNDDLSEFVDWWSTHGDKQNITLPESEKSLKIMTIHKSKGLEFPIVFVPFVDWSLDKSGFKADYLWLETGIKGLEVAPVKYEKKMNQSFFNTQYEQHRFNNYLDFLNLFYVATTRAENELYVYTEKQNPKTIDAKNFKFILNELKNIQQNFSEDYYINIKEFYKEDEDQFEIGTKEEYIKKHKSDEKEKISYFKITNTPLSSELKYKKSDIIMSSETYESIKFGNIYHAIMSKSETKDSAIMNIQKMFLKSEINKDQKDKITKLIHTTFDNYDLQEIFSRGTHLNEMELQSYNQTLRPDKVIENDEEYCVVDFKTGLKYEEHKEQILKYCDELKKLSKKRCSAYLYYVSLNDLETVL